MDSACSEVYAAMVATGYSASRDYPQGGTTLPHITYSESTNRGYSYVAGQEYLTEVEYKIEAWGATPDITDTMAAAIDTRMVALGFRRTFAIDLYEEDTRVYHKHMRYRGVIHIAEQKIYQ